MASESTVRNYPCLYDESSDDFKETNEKSFARKMLQKRLVLALVSEHYSGVFLPGSFEMQVLTSVNCPLPHSSEILEINTAVIRRKSRVKKNLAEAPMKLHKR